MTPRYLHHISLQRLYYWESLGPEGIREMTVWVGAFAASTPALPAQHLCALYHVLTAAEAHAQYLESHEALPLLPALGAPGH